MHRAESVQLRGAWDDALEALERAAQRALRAGTPRVAAHASYRRGEILRLRGELDRADDAFREAARGGREPQPGLALLRLAQGDTIAALASINRALEETSDPAQRARLLPAQVEIALAAGDLSDAQSASEELAAIADDRGGDMLTAMAAQASGAVESPRATPAVPCHICAPRSAAGRISEHAMRRRVFAC